MFTLKIKWERYEADGEAGIVSVDVADETTLFIAADCVKVHGEIKSLDEMKAWEDGSFQNYAIEPHSTANTIMPSRLIEVTHGEETTWYLATRAWVMGPDGATIEKIAA